jgi:hypothetical protein
MNTTTAKQEVLRQMAAEAEAELAGLREQVKVQEKYLAHLRSQLGQAGGRIPTNRPESNGAQQQPGPRAGVKLYEQIQTVLHRRGEPLRVPEMEELLAKAGITTNAKGGMRPNIVSAIKRHPELFSKQGWGLYGLKEWEEQKEKAAGR